MRMLPLESNIIYGPLYSRRLDGSLLVYVGMCQSH